MPFKDIEKAKKYRQDNKLQKSEYDKEYKKVNSEAWNFYQRTYKIEKRIREVEEIKMEVLEMDIAETSSLTFKAAVILLFIIKTGYTKTSAIAYRTLYPISEVKTIFSNWIENGIYKQNTFLLEDDSIIGFTLICMCGAGEIVRFTKK